METVNVTVMECPDWLAFDLASRVERWPALLPHYRWVRFRRSDGDGGGLVEMAARRQFGALAWPVWWMSEMAVDRSAPAVRYRHVAGITRGMEVLWSFEPATGGTRVSIVHRWERPRVGRWAAGRVVGPHFVRHIAGETLRWLKREAEGRR
jgi:ribosome-associated toxin RatA of RatAB toxin-antitoxin module